MFGINSRNIYRSTKEAYRWLPQKTSIRAEGWARLTTIQDLCSVQCGLLIREGLFDLV